MESISVVFWVPEGSLARRWTFHETSIEGHKEIKAEAGVSTLEREFGQLVYRLCGLTPEEIAIVEKASPCPIGLALMVTLMPFFSQPDCLLIAD